ncbi:MAG: hypothetical protein HN846_00295 [Candidatus Pacebacteria bacterium]|jgi:hypothetical protein|nr:hypothetical protein [Candidatus Paceibacterota bacterium]MBT3512062.1 hypothetical protein [Candidatus Paceibacterota bacterium]MBT4004823.1 hypothetical protein [Candidatus Paceibacterota bacterium]MBT4358470.1 hypothetical protein [Candidatus Paceibacterota bacterium]MBT4681254.1 hypothetical protein [Candidatus Paceibacterota bacterium]
MVLRERVEHMTPQKAIGIVVDMIEKGRFSNAYEAALELQSLTGKDDCTENNYEKIREAFRQDD